VNGLAIDHPYYCEEINYLAPRSRIEEFHNRFDSWADFEGGFEDFDYNLLFRWDWKRADPDDFEAGEAVPDHDTLWLFFMLQRKGLYVSAAVNVTDADGPAVRAWLLPRWEHLRKLWAPISVEVTDE
jgi:hypothetical protein